VTQEPFPAGKRGPEPRDTWLHQSPSQSGGVVWSHWTYGGTGAHLGKEQGSGAIGHVAAPELTLVGRQSPELSGTWQGLDSCPVPYLVLNPVCGGTWSARVPTLALWPTLGEAMNPQVGPTNLSMPSSFKILPWQLKRQ
jgi:hypothetical protein